MRESLSAIGKMRGEWGQGSELERGSGRGKNECLG